MKSYKILVAAVLSICISSHAVHSQVGITAGMEELSSQISKEMSEFDKRTIAVTEFSDLHGNITDFGKFVSEELITRLFQTRKFRVIERHLLNKIIEEQKLQLDGFIDPKSAQELGQLLGVDAITSGTITDLGQSIRINARLIDTGTGEVFAVAATDIFKDASVLLLLERIAGIPPIENHTPSPTPEPATGTFVESEGFRFYPGWCERVGRDNIVCIVGIENIGNNERHLRIGGARAFGPNNRGITSEIYDNLGNQYAAYVGTKIGQEEHWYVDQRFSPGLRQNVRFTAREVSIDPDYMSVIIGILEWEDRKIYPLKERVFVRNIPFKK